LSEILTRVRADTARTVRNASVPQASIGPHADTDTTAVHQEKIQEKQNSAHWLHILAPKTAHRIQRQGQWQGVHSRRQSVRQAVRVEV